MRWRKAGRSVLRLVEKIEEAPTFDDLTAAQQEIMCSEFLRTDQAGVWGLPSLVHLTVPVGRTMRNIDLHGIDKDGQRIVGQVKHSHLKSNKKTLETLSQFVNDSSVILFCDTVHYEQSNGIHIVPIREVFRIFTESDLGSKWLFVTTGMR